MFSMSSVTLIFFKVTCFSDNFLSVQGCCLLHMTFSMILLVWDIKDIVLLFPHSVASLFFGICTSTNVVQSQGNFPVVHICLMISNYFFRLTSYLGTLLLGKSFTAVRSLSFRILDSASVCGSSCLHCHFCKDALCILFIFCLIFFQFSQLISINISQHTHF